MSNFGPVQLGFLYEPGRYFSMNKVPVTNFTIWLCHKQGTNRVQEWSKRT